MKRVVNTYQFNAAARTVTLSDYPQVQLSNFLIITNTTDNVIIYNFAVTAKGGTVSDNVLTLTFDTTTMSNSDELEIYYEDPALMPSTREEQYVIEDYLNAQLMILQQLNALTNAVNGAALNSVLQAGTATIGSINAITTLPTLANVTTVATVTTVTGVTNLSQIGAVNAAEFLYNASQVAAGQVTYANIFYS